MAEEKVGLGAAAAALEAELRRFEQVTDLAARLDLKSQKNLERAARAAQEAAEAQARVAERDVLQEGIHAILLSELRASGAGAEPRGNRGGASAAGRPLAGSHSPTTGR